MLLKVLWGALILFLFWLGIKILVRMFPVSRGQLRKLGDTGNSLPIPYATNPKTIGLIYFVFKFVPFGLTAGIEREQKKVLQKKLNDFKTKRKKIEKQQLKYRASPYDVMESQLDEWQNLVDSNEFDYTKLIGEIDKSERLHNKYLKGMLKSDKFLIRCIKALQLLASKITNQDDLDTLPNIEKKINNFKNAIVQLGNTKAMEKYLYDLEQFTIGLESDATNYNNEASTQKSTNSNQDPYSILGLSPGATLTEIKKAYKAKALRYHPDRKVAEMSKISDADIRAEIEKTFDEKLKAINDAYAQLTK